MQRRPRRTERVAFHQELELWHGRSPLPVRATNLSEGGLFIQLSEDAIPGAGLPERGSYLTLRIALPGQERFSALCRVSHVVTEDAAQEKPGAKAGLGVRFFDLSLAGKARIQAYLEQAQARDATV